MSEFLTFVEVGFRHITDLAAMDHILFLVALAVIYRLRDWRNGVWAVTAFTVGHSITLGLAVTEAVRLPTALIEFLIPVTIVATCVENIIVASRRTPAWRGRYRPVLAGIFGLVHGAGFANYLRDLFVDRIALPLFGFNVGIELGQLVVLLATAVAMMGVDQIIRLAKRTMSGESALRLRVAVVSSVVLVISARWAVERSPW